MRPIRVLQLFKGYAVEGPLGGIERFGIELCRELNQIAHVEPIACGLWAYGTPYEHNWLDLLLEEGIQAFTAAEWDEAHPYRGFREALAGLKAKLRGQQVDIIHSHSQFADIAALMMKRSLKAKAVIRTVHNELEWARRPLRRLILTNWLYPWLFAREAGVSQQVVANLNRRPGARFKHSQALCIYNSINLRRFEGRQVDRIAKKNELGLPAEAIVIGSVGRLSQQKGYSFLIQAAAQVCQQKPEARFVIAGGGELAADLAAQIDHLKLGNQVLLTGPRRDIEELYGIMDLFVLPSLWEGLPTVILESFASNVPVIATDVSGSRELIKSGHNGVLVSPKDVDALVEAILTVLSQPALALTMSKNAKAQIETFTIPYVAKQYTDLYRRLAQKG